MTERERTICRAIYAEIYRAGVEISNDLMERIIDRVDHDLYCAGFYRAAEAGEAHSAIQVNASMPHPPCSARFR